MSGIDDDLMECGISKTPNSYGQNSSTSGRTESAKSVRGIDVVLKIIHYIIDAGMLSLSVAMMCYEGTGYPLFFCAGLIVWMAYRILFFKRSDTIDILKGTSN